MIKRPCQGLPPGAPCPTYQSGTWPKDCVCYQEAQRAGIDPVLKRWLIFILIACVVFSFVMIKASGADVNPSCLTKEEAGRRYPKQWLYWHTAQRCWDNRPMRADTRHPTTPKTDRLPIYAPLVDMPSGPTIAYPTLMHGVGTTDNMLRPEPLISWPPVFDFDTPPPLFLPWQQRVVMSLPAGGELE
jgi:hypothetical protein